MKTNPVVRPPRLQGCTRWLLLAPLLLAGSAWGIDGAFRATESWSATLTYKNWGATGYNGTKQFSGSQTGIVTVVDGRFTLLDRTGVSHEPPDGASRNRILSALGGTYTISGGRVMPYTLAGATQKGILYVSCFAVSLPIMSSEIPIFSDYTAYSASGSSLSSLRGFGDMEGMSLDVRVSSTLSLSPVVAAPAITQQPKNLTVTEGQDATFVVAASGTPPLAYFWRKNLFPLGGPGGSSLTISNVQPGDAGNYSVIVSNALGKVASVAASLKVNPPPTAPSITVHPTDRTVVAGQTATLTVAAAGTVPLDYRWHFNGSPLQGKTTATLSLPAVHPDNQGDYFVVVTNAAGAATSAVARMTVIIPPDATKPTLTVAAPPTATLTVYTNAFRFTGTAKDNVGISNVIVTDVLDRSIVTSERPAWSATVMLEPGPNIFRLKALDLAGNTSATLTRTIVFVVTNPVTLVTQGAGKIIGATNGQMLKIGHRYIITAKPDLDHLFAGWSGDVAAATPVLNFLMLSNLVLQANFVPNPFIPLRGTYAGLFQPGGDPAEVSNTNSGAFSLALTSAGSFSGRLVADGGAWTFAGAFDLEGKAVVQAKRTGRNPLTVQLELDLAGAGTLSGDIADGTWLSPLRAALAGPSSLSKRYTLLFSGGIDPAAVPHGHGAGTVQITASQSAVLSATLGDGTPVLRSGLLTRTGAWPLYAPLYGGRGMLLAWVDLTSTGGSFSLSGTQSHWLKPSRPSDRYYPAGFHLVGEVLGSDYVVPPSGRAPLDWTNGTLRVSGGNLDAPSELRVTMAGNKVLFPDGNPDAFAVVFNPLNGLLTGSFRHPVLQKQVDFKGAVLQKPGWAGGWFNATNQSGAILIEPEPEP